MLAKQLYAFHEVDNHLGEAVVPLRWDTEKVQVTPKPLPHAALPASAVASDSLQNMKPPSGDVDQRRRRLEEGLNVGYADYHS
jgi:hypothetical protein